MIIYICIWRWFMNHNNILIYIYTVNPTINELYKCKELQWNLDRRSWKRCGRPCTSFTPGGKAYGPQLSGGIMVSCGKKWKKADKFKVTRFMWVKQCHNPSPSYHHFYRSYISTIPSHGWFMALFYHVLPTLVLVSTSSFMNLRSLAMRLGERLQWWTTSALLERGRREPLARSQAIKCDSSLVM